MRDVLLRMGHRALLAVPLISEDHIVGGLVVNRRQPGECAPEVIELLREDNPKNLKLVRDTLQVKGYRTVEAGMGEEGVQLAREQHPALVLMDVQLPGISEVDAFPIASRSRDAVHSRHRRDCVGGGPRAAEGHAAVFDGFQGKPISLRELLETIRQILDR